MSDLLAEQPDDELRRMREVARGELTRLQEELSRVTIEVQQLDQALAKRRRSNAPGRGGVTAETVLEVAGTIEPPFSASEMQTALLAVAGIKATVNAIRNHLNRLAERGELRRSEKGYSLRFTPAGLSEFVPLPTTPAETSGDAKFGEASDDDIPF